jgi:hypothetical protein
MIALLSNTRLFANEELTLGMTVFQRTNSVPAAALAISADILWRTARRIFDTLN